MFQSRALASERFMQSFWCCSVCTCVCVCVVCVYVCACVHWDSVGLDTKTRDKLEIVTDHFPTCPGPDATPPKILDLDP